MFKFDFRCAMSQKLCVFALLESRNRRGQDERRLPTRVRHTRRSCVSARSSFISNKQIYGLML